MFKKIFVMVICLAALAACVEKQDVVDQARVNTNRAKIERCRQDSRLCIGGFLRWRKGNGIYTITAESGSFKVLAIGLDTLEACTSDSCLNRMDDIILTNELEWGPTATRYMRQFVHEPGSK